MTNQPPQGRQWFQLPSASRPTVPSAPEPSTEPRPFFLQPTFRPLTPNPQMQPTETPSTSGPAPIAVPLGPVAQPTFREFTSTLPSSQTVEPARQPSPVVAPPAPALATEPRPSVVRPTFRTLNSTLPVQPPEPVPPSPAATPTPPDTSLPRPPSYRRLSTVAQSTSITAPPSPQPPPIVSSGPTSALVAVLAPTTTQPVPTTSTPPEPTPAPPNAASPTPHTPNVRTQQPATPKPFALSTSLPASPGKKTPPSSSTLQPERFSPSTSSPKPTIPPPSSPVKKALSTPPSTTLPPERFSPTISYRKPTIPSPSSSSNGSSTTTSPKIINSISTVKAPPQSPKPKHITAPPSLLTLPPPELKFEAEHKSQMPPEVEQKTVHFQKTINNSPKRDHYNFQNNSAYNHHNPSFQPHNGNPNLPENVEMGEKVVLKKITDSVDQKRGMRVITIAGENKGAIMELVHLPRKNGGENIHYLHKKGQHENDNEHGKKSTENGQGKGTCLEDKSQKMKGNNKQNPLPSILNSNFQESLSPKKFMYICEKLELQNIDLNLKHITLYSKSQTTILQKGSMLPTDQR